MSVHNGEAYLSQAIEGILDQTFADFELIIIDDGSTDRTARILDSYRDPRILHLGNEVNLGLAKSLNRGVDIARGEFLARQDADDISFPGRLAAQVRFLDENPRTGLVGTTTEWIDAGGKTLRIWRQPTSNADIQQRLLRYCPIMHGSVMLRRQALREVGGHYNGEMRTGQDYDLWLRMSERWDIAVLPTVLYRYRWHDEMASRTRKEEQSDNARMALEQAIGRRLSLGHLLLGYPLVRRPKWLSRYSRSEWAARYLWWAAGARIVSKGYSFRFAVASVLLNPLNQHWWTFMAGVAQRKIRTSMETRPGGPSSQGDDLVE